MTLQIFFVFVRRIVAVWVGMLVVLGVGDVARAGVEEAEMARGSEESSLEAWWDGAGMMGDWFSLRKTMEERGVRFRGGWTGTYFGILDSENGSGSALALHLAFGSVIDFRKLSGWDGLEGLTGFVDGRWREPGVDANPNVDVEANGLFNPSRFAGGTGWRLLSFGLNYKTSEIFGVKDFLEVRAGWIQPQREFVRQPLATDLAINNAVGSAVGLGGNIPFSASFSTWGGTLEVKPNDWSFTKLGLFMSYPDAASPQNNGLMFRGYAPNTSENSLFFMGETGVTPEFGRDKREGRYVFGGYFYGEDTPQTGTDKYGFYWQADQRLFREGAGEGEKLSEEGLRAFSLFVFGPNGYNVNFPFYMHGGLVYEGLIPGRERDQLVGMVALGQYSERLVQKARVRGAAEPSTTTLIETGYRFRVNRWSYVQPFFQYIVQPNGTTSVANASILGVSVGVQF